MKKNYTRQLRRADSSELSIDEQLELFADFLVSAAISLFFRKDDPDKTNSVNDVTSREESKGDEM